MTCGGPTSAHPPTAQTSLTLWYGLPISFTHNFYTHVVPYTHNILTLRESHTPRVLTHSTPSRSHSTLEDGVRTLSHRLLIFSRGRSLGTFGSNLGLVVLKDRHIVLTLSQKNTFFTPSLSRMYLLLLEARAVTRVTTRENFEKTLFYSRESFRVFQSVWTQGSSRGRGRQTHWNLTNGSERPRAKT